MLSPDALDELTDDEYDAELLIEYLTFLAAGTAAPQADRLDLGPPGSARPEGGVAADNEAAWGLIAADPRFAALGMKMAEARMMSGQGDAAVRAGWLARWDERLHPRVQGGPRGGQFGTGSGSPPPAASGAVSPAASLPQAHGTERFGVPDSLSAWTRPNGTLEPARAALHAKIISEALAGHTASEHPTATFLGGGTASGKSTLGAIPSSSVAIDADGVKAKLPEYQAMVKAGDPKAAAYVHEESSAIAKAVQAGAIAAKADFTLDGTGDAAYAKMKGKIDAARKAGYLTVGKYVTVDTDEAVRRAAKRAERTGRAVPEAVIRSIHASVTDVFRQVAEHGDMDALELWDNNGDHHPVLVGEKKLGGSWAIKDEKAWQRFLSKSK